MKKNKTALILYDIRSTHNVGSIFRTADAVGVDILYLTGYTPGPLDRFGREVKEVAKVALGAQKNVPWEKLSLEDCFKKLKSAGYKIIAVEQSKKSVDYKKLKQKGDMVFIFGNEVDGLSSKILSDCDEIAEIPMQGKFARSRHPGEGGKESLNVGVAVGVALFRILDL